MIKIFAIYVAAAVAEIAGCFSFWGLAPREALVVGGPSGNAFACGVRLAADAG